MEHRIRDSTGGCHFHDCGSGGGMGKRTFKLVRTVDVSGVSGIGVVAEGIRFHDRQCAMSWYGQYHSLEVHPSIQKIKKLHGHHGATKVVWD